MKKHFRSFAAVACLAGLSLGCGGGERSIVDPPPPGSQNPAVTLVAHSEDAAVANQLGWSSGVPGAEVTVTPADGDGAAQSFTSGNTGRVQLPQLTEGRKYLISVRRVLTTQESARLGAGTDVLGFAGFDTVTVGSVSASPTFTVAASRRGSLVISEWSFIGKFELCCGTYDEAGFIEVYNNSDSTIYLDGMILGVGFVLRDDYPNLPCSMFDGLRTDATRIWSLFHEAFPGSGRDYPVLPGKIAVVANSAIDHSVYSSGLLDLRSADFELSGGIGANNPAVPNMVSLSVETPPFGQYFSSLGAVTFVATPGPVDELPRQSDPRSSRLWRGFPASRVIDVFATSSQYDSGYKQCPRMLHENFDRRNGVFIPFRADDYLTSVSRRSFVTVDGRARLQDTRTSAADFTAGSRTPGQIQ